ncbi:hypothetical protein MP228_010686 [Amoeboaphelidium protococcarum]|nr:hypothetical protein MP228_010686 [Amoeboaphelidium protococcarum]
MNDIRIDQLISELSALRNEVKKVHDLQNEVQILRNDLEKEVEKVHDLEKEVNSLKKTVAYIQARDLFQAVKYNLFMEHRESAEDFSPHKFHSRQFRQKLYLIYQDNVEMKELLNTLYSNLNLSINEVAHQIKDEYLSQSIRPR